MIREFLKTPEPITGHNIILAPVTRRFLKIFFTWSEGDRNIWFYLKFLWLLSALSIGASGLFGFIYYHMSKYGFEFEPIADALAGCLLYVWTTFCVITFSLKQSQFESLLDDLGDFTEDEKPSGIEHLNKQTNQISCLFGIWMLGSTFLVAVYNFFITCEDHIEDNCGMLINYWLPLEDFFTRSKRRLSLFMQLLAVTNGCCPSFFGPWSMLNVSEFIVNRIDHLIDMISIIPELETRALRRIHIGKCVEYHLKILKLTDRLEESSYTFLLIHIPYTTFMLTLISIQLLTVVQYLNIVHMSLWFFYICLACYYGERLLSRSKYIGMACYISMPLDGDLETQRDLLFMLKTNRELQLSGGMSSSCNHKKFIEVLKTTYGFITLLGDLATSDS